ARAFSAGIACTPPSAAAAEATNAIASAHVEKNFDANLRGSTRINSNTAPSTSIRIHLRCAERLGSKRTLKNRRDPRRSASKHFYLLLGLAEIDGRRGRNRFLVFDREIRLGLVAEHHRSEILREAAHVGVVVLNRRDVAIARDGDAVLGAFELRLQI